VVALTVVVCAGCALRGGADPSRRLDGAAGSAHGATAGGVGAASTLEAHDPVLSGALIEVAVAPTSERHLRIAERYRELGILDAAFDHYVRARGIAPHDARAYDGLARVWRDWGFPDRALAEAARAIHYAPDWPVSHNTSGTILAALGRGPDARRAFERALALDARATYAHNNLCYVSFLEGDAPKAFSDCRAALSIDPTMAAARNNLALIYAAARRDDLAEREFLAAGDTAAAAYNIGLVHLAEKRYDEAWHAFIAAARQRPAWAAAREQAARTRALAAKSGKPVQ
jgi:tetratricopeptide (TPR) repeat protein